MTPEQLDHLRRIDAHLANLLDIAAKRTPGEWASTSASVRHGYKGRDLTAVCSVTYKDREDEANATFIASCAGNAEAGWRATRAAIALLLSMGEHQHDIETAKAGFDALESILAAFPNI